MKKALIFLCSLFIIQTLSAQTYNTVDVADEVYTILTAAESRGTCSTLQNVKPYTEIYISKKLDEIINNVGEDSTEGKIALHQKTRFEKKDDGWDWKNLTWRISNNSEKVPITFIANDNIETSIFGGTYDDSGKNAFGYEAINRFHFRGDFGRNISYSCIGFIEVMKVPMEEVGDHDIGGWWYEADGNPKKTSGRKIKVFRNNAAMPYSYKKYWDGSIFYFSNVNNSGLEGWPFESGFGYGMYTEVTGAFLEDHFQFGIGRYNREYAAMDTDASLVLNSKARPFFGFDFNFYLFKWLSFSTTTGTLEFPNQDYIVKSFGDDSAWPKENDSYYFQNMFSIGMLNLDWKYVHFDFGSSCVYPKRGELGYFFPFLDRIVYQDNIGDYDNLAIFGDIKIKIPKYASIWFSAYLDEKSTLEINKVLFEKTRNMFAYQAGAKVNLPSKIFPFGTVSFRYTKIEPYCYTHHAINYTPWYSQYISESYTNNGSCLGYYMPPNSDEFLLRLDTRPLEALALSGQVQLTRHGADYGTRAVPGSSLYSEMNPDGRDDLYKYFLKDGAYEWTVGVSVGASYDFKKHGLPIVISSSIGFLKTWWTDTDEKLGEKGSYSTVDNSEYSGKTGVVMSLGVKVFGI